MGMVVATEELSWGSLGVGGSLITRPEILTRALVYGGTEEQKKHWLPKLASAEILAAVAVTEPDYGSDVAGIVTSATPVDGGLGHQRRQDVVHLRRPGRRAHAAGADRPRPVAGASRASRCSSSRSRGATATASSSPRAPTTWRSGRRDLAPGRLEGRPIDTLGYRGMHSYELAFENWFVPDGEPGRRRGGARQGLLPPDAGLRERAAADGGPRARRDAGGVRGGRRPTPPSASCSARRSSTTS